MKKCNFLPTISSYRQVAGKITFALKLRLFKQSILEQK
jgi:hypothetical protein